MKQQVVGGTIEANFQFPWVIDVSGTLTGKGVLIAPTWVLTAAHVVETSFSGVRISYSRTDPKTGKVSSGNQTTAAGSVKLHPDYKTGSPDADLALVRLFSPFASDPFLLAAALPAAAAAVGQAGTIASISHTETLPPGKVAVWRGPVILTGPKTFIAKSPTASLCPGDSGSGFVSSISGANVVAGIASQANADDCTRPNIEFTAVDVYEHLDWIRTTTDPPIGTRAEAQGAITFLRVHDVGTGYGPPSDFLDVDVVISLDTLPGRGFGFQLRADSEEETRHGMLGLLRDAFARNSRVTIDYTKTGLRNGRILYVAEIP